jgi:hypothetical protein
VPPAGRSDHCLDPCDRRKLRSRFATPFVDCRRYGHWQRGERLPPNVSADPP